MANIVIQKTQVGPMLLVTLQGKTIQDRLSVIDYQEPNLNCYGWTFDSLYNEDNKTYVVFTNSQYKQAVKPMFPYIDHC